MLETAVWILGITLYLLCAMIFYVVSCVLIHKYDILNRNGATTLFMLSFIWPMTLPFMGLICLAEYVGKKMIDILDSVH